MLMAKKAEAKKGKPSQSAGQSTGQSSKDEQVGFHKASLMTLSKERQELMRILGIVEQLMQIPCCDERSKFESISNR